MDITHSVIRYVSRKCENNEEGYIGQELCEIYDGQSLVVARILFWDAAGEFFVETSNEIPLTVLEKFIADTKEAITPGTTR